MDRKSNVKIKNAHLYPEIKWIISQTIDQRDINWNWYEVDYRLQEHLKVDIQMNTCVNDDIFFMQ